MSNVNEYHSSMSGISTVDRQSWERVRGRLRIELGEAVYNSWFARLELERAQGNAVLLTVPTKFLRSWIRAHYADRIKARVTAEFPSVDRIIIDVRSPFRKVETGERQAQRGDGLAVLIRADAAPASERARISSAEPAAAVNIGAFSGSPLDRRLSFSTFIVGSPNKLAHAAASRAANAQPGDRLLFNPLYVHAAVGLGKTHLLQAVAHAANEHKRRTVYLTAEKFMSGFVSALRTQTSLAFKDKLRAIDFLIVDDIQFLQGKSLQQEFCHALNALIDAGRQIIVAADRPSTELDSMDDRMRSRLEGGLCVEIGSLDEELRLRILEQRIAAAKRTHAEFDVPPEVISYVARAIVTNGRDLEGAVNRLLAQATLTSAPLSLRTAEAAIHDLVRMREGKRVTIDDIQKLVVNHYNISRADILSSRRTASVVRPRQIAMYLAKALTLRSLPEIGRRFGGRDHTTVLHAVRKIDGLVVKDPALFATIELLKRTLTE